MTQIGVTAIRFLVLQNAAVITLIIIRGSQHAVSNEGELYSMSGMDSVLEFPNHKV